MLCFLSSQRNCNCIICVDFLNSVFVLQSGDGDYGSSSGFRQMYRCCPMSYLDKVQCYFLIHYVEFSNFIQYLQIAVISSRSYLVG